MKKIYTLNMSRDEWLNARRKGIGGSDVAAILGQNPYRSPMAVYLNKIGETKQPEEDNEKAYWGTVLEDVVARHYAKVNGVKVRKNNHILIDEERPFMIANIDREVFSDTEGHYGYEGKTTDAHNSAPWNDDGVPIGYVYQVQHYMAVTGLPFFDVACLIGGNNYVQRRVPRDEELIEFIVEKEAEFWLMVETKTPPAWDGSQNAWDVLKMMYPASEQGKVVNLPPELAEALYMYRKLDAQKSELNGQAKEVEKQRDVYKQQICAAMGDAETGYLDGMEISYKTTFRKGYTTKDTTFRTFKIKDMIEKGVA